MARLVASVQCLSSKPSTLDSRPQTLLEARWYHGENPRPCSNVCRDVLFLERGEGWKHKQQVLIEGGLRYVLG